MDFELSEEQRAFLDTAREFASHELAPHASRWDAEEHFPRATITRAGQLGFCGLYVAPALGGVGLKRLDATLVFEALAEACPSTAAFISIHNMAAWMITEHAAPEVAQHWGPRLSSGECLASYCLTEPASGSDAASLRTQAQRDGDHYVLQGSKVFISGAGATDILVVMARTGAPGAAGITAFAVPATTPGVHFGKPEHKLGWHTQPTRSVMLDHVRIPVSHRLGQEGQGFRLALQALDGGRINIAACSVGAAQAALQAAQRYLHERQQFGQPLASFQALQFKLADMATDLVAARQMVRLAASRLDAQHPEATLFCAMAKRMATDIGFDVCNQALQIHGGYGCTREYPLERLLRDTRVHQIVEGTNEIMRVIIARRVLQANLPEVLQ